MALTKIILTGASGSLGAVALDRLVAAGFSVTVLRRAGSTATFSVPTVDADFSSLESLKSALAGQDAVVSTVGSPGLESQLLLVDAAAAVGIQRFLPSEYGSDLDNAKTRALPVFAPKVAVQERLFERAKDSSLTYTFVYNAAFLDWGLQHGFLLRASGADAKIAVFDGGNIEFGAVTLAGVADAIVGVLRHPDETKNRAVRVKEAVTTQNRLLELSKQVAPSRPWETSEARVDDLTAKADERLKQGLLGPETFVPYLVRAILDPAYGSNFAHTDNELLGVELKDDKFIASILEQVLGA